MKRKINTKYNDALMLRWYSDVFPDLETAETIFKDLKENLKTTFHPYCGWRSYPNQNYKTIYINKFGLRSPEIDLSKNTRDLCMFLGGSVAWGFGASNNENIPSYKIQKFFDKNSINYEVINFSQNSANSHDELKTFVSSVDEIKPKLIISLSGINDFFQIAKLKKTGFSKIQDLHTQVSNFFQWGQKLGIATEKNDLKKIIKFFSRFLKKDMPIEKDFFQFKEYSNTPFELFSHKIDIMENYCNSKKIKMIHVLQPTLFTKQKKSKSEKEYIDFYKKNYDGIFQIEYLQEHYEKLKTSYFNNLKNNENSLFLDFSNIFKDNEESIFFDTIHMSDLGNEIITEKIVEIFNSKFLKK